VFRNEPDIDPRYRDLDNAFLLPHLGSATVETRIAMGMRAVDNLEAFFKGERPKDLLTG
jgi:glyoxylate reductase